MQFCCETSEIVTREKVSAVVKPATTRIKVRTMEDGHPDKVKTFGV